MIDRVFTRLISAMTWPVMRRAVAIICAVAFFAVSIAHSVQHFDGAVPTQSAQIHVTPSDASPDPLKTFSTSVEHCPACSMIALDVSPPIIIACRIAGEWLLPWPDETRIHSPVAETPPPIATI